jgi:hypothetical protein
MVKTDRYLISYKNQMEFYQWLFLQNGFNISKTGYFVFANALKNRTAFDDQLIFEKTLIEYQGDHSWIEPTLLEIKNCLENTTIPDPSENCSFCQYFTKIQAVNKIN